MRNFLAILTFTLFVSGCVSAPPTTSKSSANAGMAAQKRGDWVAAAQLFQQAIDKEQGIYSAEFNRHPQLLAIYYYELGRSLGVLRRYDAAENNLRQALHLDEKTNGPKGMDLTELARLNHARGDNKRAATYFDQILPRMDEASEADPGAYLALLREAASVYRAVGQTERSAELEQKADRFSRSHPKASLPSGYGWTPYNQVIKDGE